jgi:hypothetical protein
MYNFAKNLDINFVIVSPDPNIGRLIGTVRSIKNNYKEDASIICLVEKKIKKQNIDEMKSICPTFKGEQTITSLMNKGMQKSKDGWVMFIIEGAFLPKKIEYRYSAWIENEKDILFPIVVNYDRDGNPKKIFNTFSECTLNGIMINKKFFLDVGNFSENPLKISKEFWSYEAVSKGAKFKALLGVKI